MPREKESGPVTGTGPDFCNPDTFAGFLVTDFCRCGHMLAVHQRGGGCGVCSLKPEVATPPKSPGPWVVRLMDWSPRLGATGALRDLHHPSFRSLGPEYAVRIDLVEGPSEAPGQYVLRNDRPINFPAVPTRLMHPAVVLCLGSNESDKMAWQRLSKVLLSFETLSIPTGDLEFRFSSS